MTSFQQKEKRKEKKFQDSISQQLEKRVDKVWNGHIS